jgi:hypothetical protein
MLGKDADDSISSDEHASVTEYSSPQDAVCADIGNVFMVPS